MAKFKTLLEEITSFTNKGLRTTHKHLLGLHNISVNAGVDDVTQEIALHLEAVQTEAKRRSIHVP
jgi:hypothetical protein